MPRRVQPGSVRLVLDLDLVQGGPRGRLVDEQGASVDFAGWLQLMDGLEGALDRAAAAGAAAARQARPEPPATGDA